MKKTYEELQAALNEANALNTTYKSMNVNLTKDIVKTRLELYNLQVSHSELNIAYNDLLDEIKISDNKTESLSYNIEFIEKELVQSNAQVKSLFDRLFAIKEIMKDSRI